MNDNKNNWDYGEKLKQTWEKLEKFIGQGKEKDTKYHHHHEIDIREFFDFLGEIISQKLAHKLSEKDEIFIQLLVKIKVMAEMEMKRIRKENQQILQYLTKVIDLNNKLIKKDKEQNKENLKVWTGWILLTFLGGTFLFLLILMIVNCLQST